LQLIFGTLVETDQLGSRETYRRGTEQQPAMPSAAWITGWQRQQGRRSIYPDPSGGISGIVVKSTRCHKNPYSYYCNSVFVQFVFCSIV